MDTIAISISPNLEKDDLLLSLKMLLKPIQWFNFRHTQQLENQISEYFGKDYDCFATESGRGALYLLLKALGIGAGDEVVVQALTCIAVPNSIVWNQALPVYLDIDESFNINPKKIEEAVSKNTKAIIVQHAFGIPADIVKIKKIAKKYKLVVIEDLAVSLGAKVGMQKVGTFADAAFLSFGRDKVISSVNGGMIVTKNKNIKSKVAEIYQGLKYPSFIWVIKSLIHPLITSVALLTYSWGKGKYSLGKMIMFAATGLNIIERAVKSQERLSIKPDLIPAKLPGGLAVLVINQFRKLDKFNNKRKNIAKKYFKNINTKSVIKPKLVSGAIYLRFPVIVDNPAQLIKKAKKKNIILGDWYQSVVYPSLNYYTINYHPGSCPEAEKASKKIINLPTYPRMTDKMVEKVSDLFNS